MTKQSYPKLKDLRKTSNITSDITSFIQTSNIKEMDNNTLAIFIAILFIFIAFIRIKFQPNIQNIVEVFSITKKLEIILSRLSDTREKIKLIRAVTNESILSMTKDFIIYRTRIYISSIFSTGVLIRYKHSPYTDLIYQDGFDLYTIRFPKQRGLKPFTRVRNEKGEDVSNILNKYLGPYNNFHGVQTTPTMLGFSKLEFENSRTDKIQTFESDDIIIL